MSNIENEVHVVELTPASLEYLENLQDVVADMIGKDDPSLSETLNAFLELLDERYLVLHTSDDVGRLVKGMVDNGMSVPETAKILDQAGFGDFGGDD